MMHRNDYCAGGELVASHEHSPDEYYVLVDKGDRFVMRRHIVAVYIRRAREFSTVTHYSDGKKASDAYYDLIDPVGDFD